MKIIDEIMEEYNSIPQPDSAKEKFKEKLKLILKVIDCPKPWCDGAMISKRRTGKKPEDWCYICDTCKDQIGPV